MYLAHFGLERYPFRITPDPELFFPGGRRGAVLDALIFAITSGEGIVKVVGEVGSGKTMLCRMLEERLPDNVEVVYLANPSLAPDDILHAMAFELRLPVTAATERLQVMQQLQEYLLAKHAADRQVVVFVEEAQCMPLATLEEIRLLSNLETRHHKLLQIVLFGQPELEANLATPSIRQLKERITHSFTLGALRREEVRDYLLFRLYAAGLRQPDPFSPRAIARIARVSQGLIRRINILADKAMLAAYAEGSYRVDLKHVQAAVRDSEFGGRTYGRRWLYAGAAAAALLVAVVLTWFLPGGTSAVVATQAPVSVPREVVPQPQPPAPVAVEVPAAVVPEGLLARKVASTLEWLQQVDEGAYTIQLLTADNPTGAVTDFLREAERVQRLDKIRVYRTQQGDREVWGILYDEFPGYTAARQALAVLPEPLQRHKPFIRGVRAVLKEVGIERNPAESS